MKYIILFLLLNIMIITSLKISTFISSNLKPLGDHCMYHYECFQVNPIDIVECVGLNGVKTCAITHKH